MIGYGDTLHHLTATATAAPQAELDRFCNALISIREEIGEIESGIADKCAPGSADRLRLSRPGKRACGGCGLATVLAGSTAAAPA